MDEARTLGKRKEGIEMADPITLEDLLDRPIAFHRAFVTLTGSITAALMLSQAMYWRKRTKDTGRWFYKSQEEWTEETGMTRREQETARKKLLACGVWEEWRDRINHRIYFRVKIEALGVMAESDITQCRNTPLPNGGKRHSSNVSETTAETSYNAEKNSGRTNTQKPTLKTPPKPSPNSVAPLPDLPMQIAVALADDWQRWQEHLIEKGRPLTPLQAEAQIALLWEMTYQESKDSIRTAIEGGHTRFLLPKKANHELARTEPAGCNL